MQQNGLVLLQIRDNLQQNNHPEGARILDGPLAPDHGRPAPDIVLQVKPDLQQMNLDLQQNKDNLQQIKADLQHIIRGMLQIKEGQQPSQGVLQPLFLDLQHLRRVLQQKILDLQQISRRGVVREVDLQHGLLRGKRGDSTLGVVMKDEKLPPDREVLIEAYLLGSAAALAGLENRLGPASWG